MDWGRDLWGLGFGGGGAGCREHLGSLTYWGRTWRDSRGLDRWALRDTESRGVGGGGWDYAIYGDRQRGQGFGSAG